MPWALIIVVMQIFLISQESLAASGLYDMNRFLNEPHPFANPAPAQAPATIVGTPAATTTPRAFHTPQQPQSEVETNDQSGLVSEIRAGVFLHDTGPFSANEESGEDYNIEVLFTSPDILEAIWSPRPQLGISYSGSSMTSQAYLALQWEVDFWDDWFAGFSFGGMVHDGHLYGDKDGKTRKSLGCRVLFREAIDAGYRFSKHHSVMLHFDHSSNASLCERETPDGSRNGRHVVALNEGLESIGLRYGYRV